MKKIKTLFSSIFVLLIAMVLVSCDVHLHEHEIIVHEEVKATCTESGSIKYYECSVCERLFVNEEYTETITEAETVVPATGHTMTEHEGVDATCTSEGIIHYYECQVCHIKSTDEKGQNEVTDTVAPVIPHPVELVEGVEPGCTTAGIKEHYKCLICEKLYEDAEAKIEIEEADTILPAAGHSMNEVAAVEATCTEAGNIAHFECEVCHKLYADAEGEKELTAEEVVIAAKGHSTKEVAAVEATCTEVGNIEHFECEVCHKLYADAEGEKELTAEEIVVAARGHQVVEHKAVDPTCGVAGNIKYYECEVCHKYFEDAEAKVELSKEDVVVPALEHEMVHHEGVEPVVGTPGSVEHYECEVCHKYFKDAEGTQEISANEVVKYAYLITKQDAKTSGYYIDYSDSKYTFVDSENNGTFVSNNKGVGSQTSYMQLHFTTFGTISFDYSVSSESGWDKLTIYASNNNEGYRALVNGISGEEEGSISLVIIPGDYIYFQYSKDSGGDRNQDIAVISNITFITSDLFEKATLTFEVNGGDEVAPITAYKGVALVAPEVTKEGYFFDGWYTETSCENLFDFEAGLSESTTVYAKYTKGVVVSYSNTCDTEVESVLVRPNTAIVAPEVIPTSSTQYFNGWFADEECFQVFDFTSGVAVDTVVYAGWRNPVVVSFVAGEGIEIDNIYTDINVAITLPADPESEGYRFGGWYLDEACTNAFVAEEGVTESTSLYAKWIEQVKVQYIYQEEVVGTEYVDADAAYTAVTPSTFDEIVIGWYVNPELTEEFVDGTTLTVSTNLYAKIHTFAPDGVLESFVNGDGSSSTQYAWIYDYASNSFTSSNKGVSNSSSVLVITFAKESFVSFDYLVNSESNYDFIIVSINGSQDLSTKISGFNAKDITGSYTNTFEPGDVLEIKYKKDSSGNQGTDMAVISNLIINDGVPSLTITLDYQDEAIENQTVTTGINTTIQDIEGFAAYAPADTETRHFGGWYYDEECTRALEESDVFLQNVILYAKYIYPATLTFDTDGAGTIEPIQVWTGIDITASMPVNPSKSGYIFRCWLDENAEEFDPTKGVSGDMLLTAYFEELPVGSTVEEALVATLENGKFSSGTVTTTEEFQNFYVTFTPEVTDYYYFMFESEHVQIVGGSVTYSSYRRFNVVDTEGNTVVSSTSSDTKVMLEAGVTYIATYNLAYSSYTAWGSFLVEINSYPHDNPETETIDYTFGTEVTIPARTFTHRQETMIYKYIAESTNVYALHVSSNDWTSVSVYSDEELKTRVAYKNVSNTTAVVDFPTETGKTYYMVFSINWTASEILVNTITFKVEEYSQGYTPNNPYTYTVGEVINASFDSGANTYYQVEITEGGTYKFAILSNSDSNSKTIELYSSEDLKNPIAKVESAEVVDTYIEDLVEGTYVIKGYNTSTSYLTSFTAALTKVEAGAYWTTATEIVLAETTVAAAASSGYYHSFTTGNEKLWYFFAPSTGSVEVFDGTRTSLGSTAIQLEASTEYFFVVTSDTETVEVSVSTLVEYADGKTPESAFAYTDETKVLHTEAKSYTVYYEFTVAETGLYRMYSNNNGSIDTKGYLYDNIECKSAIKSNDDGGSGQVEAGYTGYKYDFYLETELTAGTVYYLKVTYTVYAANVGKTLFVNMEKVA